MSDDEELPPSKLGTKGHWDQVYERENRVFADVGDEGEVWFGESSVTKMRSWAHRNLEQSSTPVRVLECGSGNGTLLLSFLSSPGPVPQPFHLTGIDYSEGAVTLARGIEEARRESLEDDLDEDEVVNPVEIDWRVGDLLRDDYDEQWDLVLDKGTFDALALCDEPVIEAGGRLPSIVYPERVARLVRPGGFFLITSCNFTEDEVKRRYTRPGIGFTFHSSVPHKSFAFGGRSGTTVCTVAFKKDEDNSDRDVKTVNGASSVIVESPEEPLFLCIDCGGTKTDVVIASSSGVIARAVNGTSNMAEIGLQLSYETIAESVLSAVASLPDRAKGSKSNGHSKAASKDDSNGQSQLICPVEFADIWVGISGCDTPLDQRLMSNVLSPFFGRHVDIHNDAHLLGGPLLTHNCPWGIAVIAGTGSVAIALEISASGEVIQIARRGGLGYLLGDDGSAFDLGRSAIRHAVDDFDAGVEVSGGLAATIREHFQVELTGEVLAKVYHLDPSLSPIDATNERKLRISSLSRDILSAFTASQPDPLAVRAVHESAGTLAASIAALSKQLEKVPLSRGGSRSLASAALIMGGGLIRQEGYRRVLLDECASRGVVFGALQVVEDVAGQGALGLVERARRKELNIEKGI